MVQLEDAQKFLLKGCRLASTMRLSLDKCLGRVLAEDIICDMDFPPFDRSPLDGYAVRKADVQAALRDNPITLTQIEFVPAGNWPKRPISPGEATRVMTGAKIPDGADAVVRLEDTSCDGRRVSILSSGKAEKNICRRGEEFKAGDMILQKGTGLQEGSLGILAMLGVEKPRVYAKPKVGILATGSELLPISATLKPGMIRDTNSYMLAAKVQNIGGNALLMGQVKDDVDAMVEKLESFPRLSVYITTGGASVGDYDLAGRLFERLGVTTLFSGVAIKPGMPAMAGRWGDSLIVSLSGNPAACSVSFEVLVRPLLKRMAGFCLYEHRKIIVKLAGRFDKASPTRRLVWANCFAVNGSLFATPLVYQGNGMLRSIAEANALLDIPANSPPLDRGTEATALLLGSFL